MSGYRFCRTDDIPLLVDAYNACRSRSLEAGPVEPSEPPLTVEAFKRAARELGLWASSSMIAVEGETPVAVLFGAKRDDSNLVYRLAVRSGYERRGHGRHLVESLRNKIAILGPRRLVVEIPAASEAIRRFFERCGFVAEKRYRDFVGGEPAKSPPADLISPITVEEIIESGAFDEAIDRPWERALPTLKSRSRDLEGFAIASDERVESYVLWQRSGGGSEIAALGGTRPEFLRPLLAEIGRRSAGPIRMAKVSAEEMPEPLRVAVGFRRESEYIGYAAQFGAP